MANGRMITDEVSTTNLINAFAQASDEQSAAQAQVSGAHTSLAAGWSGVASNTFGGGIEEWQAGLTKVQRALSSISDSMVQFAQETTTTEDDNALAARLTPASARIAGTPMTAGTPSTASWT
jgi:WXG100 family type VII secretion target